MAPRKTEAKARSRVKVSAPEVGPLRDLTTALQWRARTLFSLRSDTDKEGTSADIKRNIEFTGANLWSLIFAILIASIGLNINSTAVIIGAMLISPLMGPIMGSGLALGTYDIPLFKRSLTYLGVATVVSIATSTFYFWLSPLGEAQSELLARTTPTIYDVLIAVFGGAAGIVAGSRRDKTNAIPGVAIATALMPPLCTAGYGLAKGSWPFFFGAFYLYFINCTFIGLSTFVFVQFLRFRKATYPDPSFVKRVRLYMLLFALVTMLPSLYLAVVLVRQTVFRSTADRFVRENFLFAQARVLRTDFRADENPRVIEVTMLGDALSADALENVRRRLANYNLSGVKLVVNQAGAAVPGRDLNELYEKNQAVVRSKDDRIRFLENEVLGYQNRTRLLPTVSREVSFLFPGLESFSFGDLNLSDVATQSKTREPTFIARWKRAPGGAEKTKLELYLKSRLDLEKLRVIHD